MLLHRLHQHQAACLPLRNSWFSVSANHGAGVCVLSIAVAVLGMPLHACALTLACRLVGVTGNCQ
jgi:hypothetical protein